MKKLSKLLAAMMAAAMVLSLFPAFGLTASAADAVTGVSISSSTIQVGVGSNITLTATVLPSGAGNKTVGWSSDTLGVASVDGNGKITGQSVGVARVTVTTDEGGYTASCDVTVTAAELIPYIDENGDSQTRADPTPITAAGTLNTGWYYVLGTVTLTDTLTVSGIVNIILTDGSHLQVTGTSSNAGINVSGTNSLSIYAQSGGTGSLTAQGRAPYSGAGIGGGYGNGGTVTINGGNITATGDHRGAGIGGGSGGGGGTVTITRGKVTATGGDDGAGIGGGSGGGGGTVTISGGTVITTGGDGGAGIGGGFYGNGGNVTITGGSVNAVGDTANGAENIGKGYNGSSGTLTDGSTNDVYLNTLTIGYSPVVDTPVTAAVIPGITYGLTDVVSDAAGKVYFYLPASAEAEISLTAGGAAYLSKYARDTGVQTQTLKLPLTGSVSISGTQKNNETLTAVVASAPVGATLTYAWYREGEGAAVQSGSSGTYTAVAADVGKTITVKVTAAEYYGELTDVTGAIGAAATGGGSYDTNYTVTFNSNGGSAVSPKSVVDGGKVAKPADPTKPDYTFGGWFTDVELTKAYDFNAKVTKNFTLYAKWVAVEVEPEETPDETAFPFDDVNDGHWFYDDVVWAWENGLLTGTSATKFSPFMNTTRGMIVTVLYRLAGEPAVTGTNTFTDVLDGHWYTDAITWAQMNGVVKGYSSTLFAPDKDITREELVTLLWRYAGSPAVNATLETAPAFLDADTVSDYAKAAFAWAISVGIVQGDDVGKLNPQNSAARAEVAAVFRRFAEKVK